MTDFSGYHDCPCRACFEIAIGADEDGSPSLCHECEDAGCADGYSECDRPDAYGCGEDDTDDDTTPNAGDAQ